MLFFNNLEEAQQVIQMRNIHSFRKSNVANLFMGCDCIIILKFSTYIERYE